MACCPGSVAAYHEALSRLRHGFEFRPGRSSFTSITSSSILRLSASTSDGFIRYRRTPLYIMSDESEYIRNSKKLSRILRHRPDIPHDEHGWISMDDVEVHGGMDRGLVMEIAQMNTLDNLLMQGKISVVDYLERVPNGYISNQHELIETIRQREAAMAAPQADGGANAPIADFNQPVDVEGGSGYGELQRALNTTGVEGLNLTGI